MKTTLCCAGGGLLFWIIIIFGEIGVPLATRNDDRLAKRFVGDSSFANVYIVRDWQWKGVLPDVVVDGKTIGKSASGTFFLVRLAPGIHRLGSPSQPRSQIDVEVDSGNNYFISQCALSHWNASAGSNLERLPNDKGRALVIKCKKAVEIKK